MNCWVDSCNIISQTITKVKPATSILMCRNTPSQVLCDVRIRANIKFEPLKEICAETCEIRFHKQCAFCDSCWQPLFKFTCILYKITERKWLDGSNDSVVTGGGEEVSFLGELGGSLQINLDSSLRSLNLGSFVGNLTSKDFFLALGLPHVFDPYMNALLNDTSIDRLVHTNSNSRLGNIENDASASVVMLVGHTFMDGGVCENINVITNLDLHLVLAKGWKSVLTELLGKHVPGAGAGSE